MGQKNLTPLSRQVAKWMKIYKTSLHCTLDENCTEVTKWMKFYKTGPRFTLDENCTEVAKWMKISKTGPHFTLLKTAQKSQSGCKF
jgi:hypothetical protein